jgi:hypothetical protein
MKTALAAAVLVAVFGMGGAKAGSIIELGESDQVSSIIMLGDDAPCAESACDPEEDIEVVDAGSAAGSSGALVDQYGMPTNMPIVMRPSMDTPVAEPVPDAAAPATTSAPAPAAETPQPVKVEEAPQGQAEQPQPRSDMQDGNEPQ